MIDWVRLAHEVGSITPAGERGGTGFAQRALDSILGRENIEAAVDLVASFASIRRYVARCAGPEEEPGVRSRRLDPQSYVEMSDAVWVQQLVGQRLTGVTFIHDYVQVLFEDARLNADNPLTVATADAVRGRSDPLFYRDVVALIGQAVTQVRIVEGEELRIDLNDGTSLALSLRTADYTGPEAGTLQMADGSLMVF